MNFPRLALPGCFIAAVLLAGCATSKKEEPAPGGAVAESSAAPNQLSRAEKAAGWRLLFDGQTTAGWRNFKKQTFPDKGWVVENGTLKHIDKGGGGDIMTVDQFENF